VTTDHQQSENRTEPEDQRYRHAIITIPNLICVVRLVGSPLLLALAIAGLPYWFVGLFLALSLSDWIDGKLARWLHQRSDLGARLDSTADAILYATVLGGAVILSWDLLRHEIIWVLTGLGSYALTTGAGLWKYGRVPSYHTYGAKLTQWIALIAGICLILGWSVWPLRFAAVAVTLTNLEATAITCVLSEWRADVLTVFHVWPKRKRLAESVSEDSE
jgi:CDP-diacylglycerol--glycerol-3-phosphate 3-phosphatidyltransferase